MPKKAVVEYQCERCPRTWYAVPPEADEDTASLRLTYQVPGSDTVEVAFAVLCTKCTSACLAYVNNIRKVKEASETGD